MLALLRQALQLRRRQTMGDPKISFFPWPLHQNETPCINYFIFYESIINSLSKKYICIKIWSAPEKLSQFLASCSRLTIQTLWNADTMSFPTYSHPNLFFKIRSSLFIRSCYYPREIALGSWHLQDWGFTLPLTSAESISLWYSQSYYSLIEIIIVSGYHIQDIWPWRWRLKTMYAPCCSRGADMVLIATGNGRIASCGVGCEDACPLQFTEVE